MESKKMTKRQYYKMLEEAVEKSNVEKKDLFLNFISKEVEKIETRAEKAKRKAVEKKAQGDLLRDAVKNVLTDNYQTIDEITEKIVIEGDEEITKAKVVARLTQLFDLGEIHKGEFHTEDNKIRVTYKLANDIKE